MSSNLLRLTLARSLLAGDANAALILADVLEEDGDRAGAEWARAKKRNIYKQMDFVIGVLPPLVSLRTACDFMVHSLNIFRAHRTTPNSRWSTLTTTSNIQRLTEAIEALGVWASDPADDASAVESCTAIAAWHWRDYDMTDLDQLMQSLHVAGTSALIANGRQLRGEEANREATLVRDASRRVARGARQAIKPVIAEIQWEFRQQAANRRRKTPLVTVPNVSAWQLEHLQCILEDAAGREPV